jgi:hypothetical protein
MHDYHQPKGPQRARFNVTMPTTNGRGTHTVAQAPTGSPESESPIFIADRWGLPQGRHRPPCWEPISH